MPVDFEWQVAEENGEWSALASPRVRRRWRPPRWVWYVLLALLLTAGGGTYAFVRQRYEQARQRLIFEIQSVIDLQARAYAADDRALFLAQVDRQVLWWYAQERHRLSEACRQEVSPAPECAPFRPGLVEDVEVRGEFALALVAEEGETRRARFYRRAGGGWLHTAPRREFWEVTSETGYQGLIVRAHRRDLPYAYPLLDRIADIHEQICAPVGCRGKELTVAVVVPMPGYEMPRWEEGALLVDSPWLSGIPALESLDGDYLLELDAVVRWASLGWVFDLEYGETPNPVQRALMYEYLEWTTNGNLDRAPLLRRLIEHNGADTLPQIIRSLPNNPSPEALARAWLALPPQTNKEIFQFLLDLEYEALRAAQFETVASLYDLGPGALLQPLSDGDDEAVSRALQNLGQLQAPEVVSVEVAGDHARVLLASGPDAPTDLLPAEFYARRDGRWFHTWPYYLLDYARARATPPGDPDQVAVRFACAEHERAAYEQLAGAFAGEHPGVAVEVFSIQDLLGAEGIGSEQDTIYRILSQSDAAVYALNWTPREWLRDLAPLIAADETFDAADVIGLASETAVWGVPTALNPIMIHYSRGAFDAAGLPTPYPGWTADEFLATARALQVQRDQNVSQYGYVSLHLGDMAWLQGQVCAAGVDLNTPAMVDAVRWYVDLARVHRVMFGSRDLDAETVAPELYWNAADTLIQQGRAAMWSSAVPGWEHSGAAVDYGFAAYPDMGCAANPAYVQGLVMSAGTRHAQETWQWLSYLAGHPFSDETDGFYAASIPARWSMLPGYGRHRGWDEYDMAMVRYALQHVAPLDDAFGPLRGAVLNVLARSWGIDSALARAQAELEGRAAAE